MDLKKAYEVLGLPEQADMAEVEKRYDLLLRQADTRIRRERSPEAQAFLDEINGAYRAIRNVHWEQEVKQYEEEKYGGQGKLKQKLDHFWEYYKLHVIGGLIAIVLVGFIAQTVIENRREANLPPPDIEIMLFGDYRFASLEELESDLLAALPEMERIRLIHVPVSFEAELGYDYASQQKAVVMLAAERPHVFIADETTFEWMRPQGGFQDLETLARNLGIPESLWVEGDTKDDPQPRVYGIDTTDSELWSYLQAPNRDKIVAVSIHHEDTAPTERLLRALLENM